MKLFWLLMMACTMFFAGCGGGTDGSLRNPTVTLYTGSYSGNDTGSLRITANAGGDITGQATSNTTGIVLTVSGNLTGNQLVFTATSGTSSLTFTGTLNTTTGTVAGSWRNADGSLSGTFTAQSS